MVTLGVIGSTSRESVFEFSNRPFYRLPSIPRHTTRQLLGNAAVENYCLIRQTIPDALQGSGSTSYGTLHWKLSELITASCCCLHGEVAPLVTPQQLSYLSWIPLIISPGNQPSSATFSFPQPPRYIKLDSPRTLTSLRASSCYSRPISKSLSTKMGSTTEPSEPTAAPTSDSKSSIPPFSYFAGAQFEFKPPLIANGNAFLGDVFSR